MTPVGTAIAGPRRAVASGTAEWLVLRTVGSTVAPKRAFAVSRAFQRETAFVGECAVELDLFAYRGLIFANRLSNGSLGGAIGNAGKNDAAFLQSKMGKRILITHNIPAFPQLSGI